jgi:hypothetical protein
VLGRFAMKREGPQEMYNRLKSLVNQVQNYVSMRWTDHEVVRLMLRSFTVLDATLVSLICENPKYLKMVPEEVLGKFVSHQMMVKNEKYIDDVANRSTPSTSHKPLLSKQQMTRRCFLAWWRSWKRPTSTTKRWLSSSSASRPL